MLREIIENLNMISEDASPKDVEYYGQLANQAKKDKKIKR